MLFETESPGDTIAAPICLTNDREDLLSRNRVDSHSDQADAEPTAVLLEDWRDTVIKPAAGCLAPSSQRQLLHRRGLGDDRRPNVEGYRNFPLRDRVCERSAIPELL